MCKNIKWRITRDGLNHLKNRNFYNIMESISFSNRALKRGNALDPAVPWRWEGRPRFMRVSILSNNSFKVWLLIHKSFFGMDWKNWRQRWKNIKLKLTNGSQDNQIRRFKDEYRRFTEARMLEISNPFLWFLNYLAKDGVNDAMAKV